MLMKWSSDHRPRFLFDNPEGARGMNERRVSDLNLAAYLTALGYPLVRIVGPNGRKEFVFGGVPEETVFNFYSGKDQISARQLLNAYRDLKGLVLQTL